MYNNNFLHRKEKSFFFFLFIFSFFYHKNCFLRWYTSCGHKSVIFRFTGRITWFIASIWILLIVIFFIWIACWFFAGFEKTTNIFVLFCGRRKRRNLHKSFVTTLSRFAFQNQFFPKNINFAALFGVCIQCGLH